MCQSCQPFITTYTFYKSSQYDGDKDYDYDTAQYTFPHRKRTYNEEDNSEDYFENAVYEDSVNFSSMADYEDFLIWGTDNKDQFI